MASEEELSDTSSLFERLVRLRDLSLFMPFIFGLTNTDPDEAAEAQTEPRSASERIILINPFTQGMMVIEGASSLEILLRDVAGKQGQPPASKASIEALPCVEAESGECAICLEEYEAGGVAKEMPCKHRFHGDCIDKWLGIHGSCPVCRHKMPVDEDDEVGKRTVSTGNGDGDGNGNGNGNGDEEGRERRRLARDVWVGFSFNGLTSRDPNQTSDTAADSSST